MTETGNVVTRALVVGPYLSARTDRGRGTLRRPEARLAEAEGLAQAIDLDIRASLLITLAGVRPATYLGKGKVAEIAATVAADEVGLVVMDCALSPVQQRNLEKAFACKVIDRTGLILEIFGRRARTREGSLQVELAHLAYQKSRLVRSWTHLERQRGGFGFLGGPGETQIETDRRLLSERMARIELDLADVKRTRGLHRKSRRDVPFPIVALVGYTNAGKSTLFNALTRAEVLAENMLFATLDPTLRNLTLPHGTRVILSDTVGFISDLPTTLVSAFRATLEEVLEADVILHVRDVSHEDTAAQSEDVVAILKELGVDPDDGERLMEVWNKLDLVEDERREAILANAARAYDGGRVFAVSALTGEGVSTLLDGLERRVTRDRVGFDLTLDPADGQGLHWLYENADVVSRHETQGGLIALSVRVAPAKAEPLRRRFGEQVHLVGAERRAAE